MSWQWKSGRLAAGKLRHRIDIVKPSPVQDSTGGINLSNDVIYANVWSSIEALSGMETFAANTQTSASSHQIIIRYIGGAPGYQVGQLYVAGQLIKDNAGYLQQCQAPGGIAVITDDNAWNEVEGMYTEDGDPSIGSFTWYNLGPAPPFTGVTSAMQVVFQGRQFQITSVLNPDEKNKMLCLLCTEINQSRQQSPNVSSADLG
jgi:head-tail adaptor